VHSPALLVLNAQRRVKCAYHSRLRSSFTVQLLPLQAVLEKQGGGNQAGFDLLRGGRSAAMCETTRTKLKCFCEMHSPALLVLNAQRSVKCVHYGRLCASFTVQLLRLVAPQAFIH
jgi:hypothetical protein